MSQTDLRELDKEIATMIEPRREWPGDCRGPLHDMASTMGAWVHTHDYANNDVCVIVPRGFSSDILLAMRVVEKLRSEGFSFACTIYQGHLPYASFCKGTAASSRNAEADTLPEAICRAALKATGEKE